MELRQVLREFLQQIIEDSARPVNIGDHRIEQQRLQSQIAVASSKSSRIARALSISVTIGQRRFDIERAQ